MPDSLPGGDEASLRAMLRTARSALHRAAGRSRERLLGDADLCDALVHRLERIQDNALCVSEKTRVRHPDLPWARLDTLRERTRRVVEAGGITALDQGILWDILHDELPLLVRELQAVLR